MTTRRSLHGDCAVRDTFKSARWAGPDKRTAYGIAGPFIANQTWEKWMKLVKTSAIAFAISALLAGPVLAQGTAPDTRGGVQGRTNNMQGGASGSGDEEFNTLQPNTPGAKAGVNAKAGTNKGTVGSGSGATKGSAGTVGDPAAGGNRY
jgi:hypothetical protein